MIPNFMKLTFGVDRVLGILPFYHIYGTLTPFYHDNPTSFITQAISSSCTFPGLAGFPWSYNLVSIQKNSVQASKDTELL